jgi:DNA ligase-1
MLADLVATSTALARTSSRLQKRSLIADLLRIAGDDVALTVDYLTASPRQRRTGVSYRTLGVLPPVATVATLTVRDVDGAFDALAAVSGAGAVAARSTLLADLFGRATADEQVFLRGLLTGELRQGALDGVVVDAVAQASGCPLEAVRRAAMLTGSPSRAAALAMGGGTSAVEAVRLTVGVGVLPMLAGSAPSVDAAVTQVGDGSAVWVDCKVDGIRAQIHKDGTTVRIFSRTLDDVTERLPEVAALVGRLPVEAAILDGEVIARDEVGRPLPFQETGSRVSRHGGGAVSLMLFDLLHVDGRDVIDEPHSVRMVELQRIAGSLVVDHLVTDDPAAAERFFRETVAAGFEGVVVKRVDSPYAAGRRGSDWVKVKPVRTADLVVLGVEWGSGRRRGKLSNIHMGARNAETGEFVMVGKTFKGMTDEMLAWQTARFLELERDREGHVVWVHPTQVVEIAFDGVQRSRRYPAGVALRFARVLRYRDDKTPQEADTIEGLREALTEPNSRDLQDV